MNHDKKDFFGFILSRDKRKAGGKDHSLDPETTKEWLSTQGSKFNTAFGVDSQWDEQEKRYKAEPRVPIEYLQNVLDTHDSNAGTDDPKFYNCLWETVFDQLNQAKGEYSSQYHLGNTALGRIDLTTKIIDIIPEEYGLGVIKGVLGLIFESTKKKVENREKILNAFETLPETILTVNTACKYLNPEPGDLNLQRDFYNNLVMQLPGLVQILLGKEPWYRKALSFVDLRIHEAIAIDDILARWNSCVTTLKGRIENMKNRLLAKVVSHSAEAERYGAESNCKLDGLGTQVGRVESKINNLEPFIFDAMRKGVSGISAEINSKWLQLQDTGAQAQTGFYLEMKEVVRNKDKEIEYLRQDRQALSRERSNLFKIYEREREDNDHLRRENSHLSNEIQCVVTPLPQNSEPGDEPVAIITHLELLGILGIPPHDSWDDLDFVFQQTSSFSPKMLGRVRYLLRMDEFVSWITEHQSSLLLIEGHLPNSTQVFTPLSVFSSTLVSSLVNSHSSLVLFFFGGLHTDEGGMSYSGPSGLIRSLTTQLLLNEKLPKPELNLLNEDLIAACKEENIKALCELFERLVLQVPSYMQVFCVLDGLALYEQHPWTSDLHYIAAMFEHLAMPMERTQMRALKVLLVFAGQSLELSDRIMEGPGVWKRISLAAGFVDPMQMSSFTKLSEVMEYLPDEDD